MGRFLFLVGKVRLAFFFFFLGYGLKCFIGKSFFLGFRFWGLGFWVWPINKNLNFGFGWERFLGAKFKFVLE